jgi:hypothetical protein
MDLVTLAVQTLLHHHPLMVTITMEAAFLPSHAYKCLLGFDHFDVSEVHIDAEEAQATKLPPTHLTLAAGAIVSSFGQRAMKAP